MHKSVIDDKNEDCVNPASLCYGVKNGTCRKKHTKKVIEDNFCSFIAASCPGVLNGTCSKMHKSSIDD